LIYEGERTEGPEATWHELRRETIPSQVRWGRRAGQWRAVALARSVFGEAVAGRLDAFPPRGGFVGLLDLEVPFESLDEHRSLEQRFLALVDRDPVLEQVPFVFTFSPVPVDVGG